MVCMSSMSCLVGICTAVNLIDLSIWDNFDIPIKTIFRRFSSKNNSSVRAECRLQWEGYWLKSVPALACAECYRICSPPRQSHQSQETLLALAEFSLALVQETNPTTRQQDTVKDEVFEVSIRPEKSRIKPKDVVKRCENLWKFVKDICWWIFWRKFYHMRNLASFMRVWYMRTWPRLFQYHDGPGSTNEVTIFFFLFKENISFFSGTSLSFSPSFFILFVKFLHRVSYIVFKDQERKLCLFFVSFYRFFPSSFLYFVHFVKISTQFA